MLSLPNYEDSTDPKPRILLGSIAPAVVLIFLLLDISLRFLPPKLIAFRGWEAMGLFATGVGPFAPNAFYENARSYGDLANLANLPHQRQYREEEFTTDAAGYRNQRSPVIPFAGILLVGNSFTAGAGVSDAETLSEQLHDISGCAVYNGGRSSKFLELFQYLKMDRGLVVYQQLGRDPLPERDPLLPVAHRPTHELVQRAVGNDRVEALRPLYIKLETYWTYSPLAILSGRAFKTLLNDVILPNPYRSAAVEGKLRNGRETLFLTSEVTDYDLERSTNPEAFVQLKLQLQKKRIGLLVLLVPSKYDTYHDLLSSPSPRTEPTPFLDTVEQRLLAADVPVINLRSQFRKQAEALLERDQYLFWLDDTHWNAEGIREAAVAIKGSAIFSTVRADRGCGGS
jgi:SGNH hydrolase-like domain, acetyltransferase AlgX